MLYQAQSTVDLHFIVRVHEEVDDFDCSVTYDREVDIKENEVDVSVLCFESESDIKMFKRTIKLPRKIIPEQSKFTWESESKVHLELKKADGPSYWPVMVDGMEPGRQQDMD